MVHVGPITSDAHYRGVLPGQPCIQVTWMILWLLLMHLLLEVGCMYL